MYCATLKVNYCKIWGQWFVFFFLSVCGDFILLVVMKFWETLLIFKLMGKQDLSLLAVVFKGGCAGLLWNASDIMMLSTRHLCQLWLCRLYFMNTVCFVGLQCPCPEMDRYWCSGWSQVPFTLDHRVTEFPKYRISVAFWHNWPPRWTEPHLLTWKVSNFVCGRLSLCVSLLLHLPQPNV